MSGKMLMTSTRIAWLVPAQIEVAQALGRINLYPAGGQVDISDHLGDQGHQRIGAPGSGDDEEKVAVHLLDRAHRSDLPVAGLEHLAANQVRLIDLASSGSSSRRA